MFGGMLDDGILETFTRIEALDQYGVKFESYTEPHFRTTGPWGKMFVDIAATIAEAEQLRISERTKAGMERAKRAGVHCGRPRRIFRIDEAHRLHTQGLSLRAIAAELGVSFMTVPPGYKSCNKTLLPGASLSVWFHERAGRGFHETQGFRCVTE
jgi:DNA invertase Pin-like site-specific DNA recombinase